MQPTPEVDVADHLEKVRPLRRQRDAYRLLEIYSRITGLEPVMWGSIVGWGEYHYRYDSGHEGDAPAASFAPRKQASVLYLPECVAAHEDALARLGRHTSSVGCLYIKDLDAVDLDVLEHIIATSFATVTAWTQRARGT